MRKKFISFLLTAGLLAAAAIPSFAVSEVSSPGFPDVSSDDWYYEACEYVGQRGIFNGMEDGTFSPQVKMSCAMFLQALANNTQNYRAGFFSKESPDAWYEDAAGWARCVNLIGDDGMISVKEPMTREKAAELMYQYAAITGRLDSDEKPGADSGGEESTGGENFGEENTGDAARLSAHYADADQISESAQDAVLWCTGQEIMQGDGELFHPQDMMTRAETAQLFMNAESLLQGARTCAIGHFDVSEVEEMLLQNGTTGVRYQCTDRETIEYITDQLNSFRYDEIERYPLADGWTLSLEVLGKDATELWSTNLGEESMSAPYMLDPVGHVTGYTYSYLSYEKGCLSELCGVIQKYVSGTDGETTDSSER